MPTLKLTFRLPSFDDYESSSSLNFMSQSSAFKEAATRVVSSKKYEWFSPFKMIHERMKHLVEIRSCQIR